MKIVLAVVGCVLVGILLLAVALGGVFYQVQMQGQASAGESASAVASAALLLQARLHGPRANVYNPTDPLMQRVTGYWQSYCSDGKGGLCPLAAPGNLQCVQFVSATQWLAGNPLPAIHNAQDFWAAYENQPGWQRIPSPGSFPVAFLPPALGDLIVWKGGGHYEGGQWAEYGHIAVVVGYQAPRGGQDGSIEVAQANAPGNKFRDQSKAGNTYTMMVHTDGRIDTWGPYVDENGVSYTGYAVLGFLRHMTPPPVPLQVTSRLAQTLPTGLSFKQTYVKEAWHAAMTTGIPPGYFVRQIRQESGFNPNAVSPAGAIGIAQFMPQTAAGLGINPYEPVQSLQGAANLMARYQKFYSGDYAKALAAYNAGEGTLQAAISAALQAANGSSWRVFLPRETQHYITAIMEG